MYGIYLFFFHRYGLLWLIGNQLKDICIESNTCFVFPFSFVVGLYRLSVHDWSQLFFASFHQYNDHNNQYLASIFITVFESSSIFGKLLFGKINDYFMRKKLTLVNNRGPSSTLVVRLSIAIGLHLISAFALFLYCNLLSTTKNISIFVLVAVIAGISSAGNVITLSILSTEIGDEKYQGLITSLCNLATKRKKWIQYIIVGQN